MTLPVPPPVAPMLAKLSRDLPRAEGMYYEPKWDGFRCIVFRDGDEVVLGSRNEKPLTRYFPELIAPLQSQLPDQCVLDGEIVLVGPDGLDFDALSNRIHPAASRVNMLAETTPASFVAFDLLALGERDLCATPYRERRRELEKVLKKAKAPLHLTPATTDPDVAHQWFMNFEGAGLDGVVAKDGELHYLPNKRSMIKVKHQRTADCVVAGFRWHKDGGIVGSLLLGLYDGDGALHHVGVTSSFTAARRQELVAELEPYRAGAEEAHPWAEWGKAETRRPGGVSRWSTGKDMTWEPLRIELVCEVAYDHLQENRFRHATTFQRWRPDRAPASCTYSQLDTPVPAELTQVFGALG
ncbi:MAG TPA: ATP-dependent DNA ligase [Acidimicrobiales bacterium]|jgi:ATP-dependent DNA ligase